MLQTIREHTQGWIAGTIISIIILTFALWGIHSYFVGGAGNSIIAEVNGTDITKEQLRSAYERLRRQVQVQSGLGNSVNAKDETALKDRALKALIDIEVLKQASYKQGFRITDMQIDNYLQSMPEFQVDGQFSVERFQRVLSSTMLSTSEFLDLLRTSLLIDQPKLGILFTSIALPDETNYAISLINQERDIDYINIPLQYFLAQPIVIPPEKVTAYYEEHKKDFMTPEFAQVDYIELSLKDLISQIKPTDTSLRDFYNENTSSYMQPAEWKLVDIEIPLAANATAADKEKAQKNAEVALQAIQNGEDFNKVAHGYTSTLTGKAWMPLNQLPAELQKNVAELTKPGQVSGVIKTDKGFTIIKALDIQEPRIQPYEAVKDKVREIYVRHQAEEKFTEARERMADLTYEHPDSLETAAKALNLPIKTSESFSQDKAGKDISQYKKVRNIAFSNDVLNLQNNSDVIQLNSETAIVLHIKSHKPSSLLPLSAVNKQISDLLKQKEAETRAQKFTEDLKNKLIAGANPQQLASTNKFVWVQAGYLPRYSNKVDSAILDLAFRLPNPKTAKNKIAYGVARLPTGYAVVAVKSVKEGAMDEKQYTVFSEQVQNSDGLLEYELYKLAQINKAKVNINI